MNKIKIKDKKFINLALGDKLKKELEKEADALGMTTAKYIRMILEKRK